VFTAPAGGALRASNFRRDVFASAAADASLAGVTPHALRHTAASLAIASGANVKVVQQMLGHKSATMTLDLYGHLFDSELDDIADRLDAAARTSSEFLADFLRTRGSFPTCRVEKNCWRPVNTRPPAVPPAGFEPATPGLGVRRSIP